MRVLDENALGDAYNISSAIDWAIQNKMDVIIMSLSYDADVY